MAKKAKKVDNVEATLVENRNQILFFAIVLGAIFVLGAIANHAA